MSSRLRLRGTYEVWDRHTNPAASDIVLGIAIEVDLGKGDWGDNAVQRQQSGSGGEYVSLVIDANLWRILPQIAAALGGGGGAPRPRAHP